MKRYLRPILGVLLGVFALSLFSREDYPLFPLLVAGFAALALLRREALDLFLLILGLLCALGKLLVDRAKKVDEMRHCKCCGALAVYMVTTCATNVRASTPAPDVKTFFVCREHHPNPKIGVRASELEEHMRTIHPDITFDRIYPHNPY